MQAEIQRIIIIAEYRANSRGVRLAKSLGGQSTYYMLLIDKLCYIIICYIINYIIRCIIN